MDKATPVIIKVSTPEYKKVLIETSDGNTYLSDLSSFSAVKCFPQNIKDWTQVTVDGYGLGLIWGTRFEVHADQVIGLAIRNESVSTKKRG